MILAEEDAALFYSAWGALLTWVNDQRKIVPSFPRPTPGHPIDPQLATQIRDLVWADDVLREQFLAEGASELGAAERDLIASWKHRVSGSFVIFKHMQKHSIFMSDAVYAVHGIYTLLEVMFPCVPRFVQAVLIPFREVIITDGLMQTPPMQISYGAGIRRMFKNQYSSARETAEVRTRLPWQADPAAASVATALSGERRQRRQRASRSRLTQG
jgi:hypothetical protein